MQTKTLSPELLHKIDAYWRAARWNTSGTTQSTTTWPNTSAIALRTWNRSSRTQWAGARASRSGEVVLSRTCASLHSQCDDQSGDFS
jgi:hypothetical protein